MKIKIELEAEEGEKLSISAQTNGSQVIEYLKVLEGGEAHQIYIHENRKLIFEKMNIQKK